MATGIWVNIGSGNGLLPDGTKPLPEPTLTYHHWGFVSFTILHEMHKIFVFDIHLKITNKKLQPHPLEVNELIRISKRSP